MRIIAGTTVLCLAVLGIARADDAKKDADKLKGAWSVVAVERNGEKLPEEITKEWKVTFESEQLTAKVSDGDKVAGFKLEPAKKPKHIDITPKDGEKKDQVLKGIYELDGDNLKICVADGDQDRRCVRVFRALHGHGDHLVLLEHFDGALGSTGTVGHEQDDLVTLACLADLGDPVADAPSEFHRRLARHLADAVRLDR